MKELIKPTAQNKIEKLDEKDTEKISGGYVGKDWNKEYAEEYSSLGITHVRNTFGYDEYYFYGYKLPKKFVYALVEARKPENRRNWSKNLAASEYEDLKAYLKSENDSKYVHQTLNTIWGLYG